MLAAALTGFATTFALIFAIGAQNAFVLRQGLMREHVLPVILCCAFSDVILISAGVAGMGGLAIALPWLVPVLTLAGAAFLVVYGALSLRRAFRSVSLEAARNGNGSLKGVLATCLAITWLNPHVYLDALGLIGAVSTGFLLLSEKVAFAAGGILASFVFFFCLGYGARLLAPLFARPRAWTVLDVAIALLMWSIAATLIAALWNGIA